MLLQKQDAHKLRKLVYELGGFALIRSGVAGSEGLDLSQNARYLQATNQLIWVQEGGLDYIGHFVDENPLRISRFDLKQVMSWKKALHADFVLMRIGADTVVTQGTHVFCVRGITEELDSLTHFTPCAITLTLLPFAGVITYNSAAEAYDVTLDAESISAAERLVREHLDTRRAIRSARDFLAHVDEARRTQLSFDDSQATRGALRLRAVANPA